MVEEPAMNRGQQRGIRAPLLFLRHPADDPIVDRGDRVPDHETGDKPVDKPDHAS